MRVAVHHPPREEPDGTPVAASVSAFRLGRITDHVDPLTETTTPAAKVAEILAERAKAAHPDCEIVIERLIEGDEEGTSRWVHHEEVPEDATFTQGGAVPHAVEFVIAQNQAAAGGEPQ